MKRRSFIRSSALGLAAGAGVAAGSLPAPAISQNRKRWDMVLAWPKNLPGVGPALDHFAETVERCSEGRLSIRIHGAGEIVPAFETLDAVSAGTVEMGHAAPYYWVGKAPATQFLCAMPFGLTEHEQYAWYEFGGGYELAQEIYDEFDLKFLVCGNTGTQMFGWFNNEISTLDDLNGLNIRIPGIGADILREVGATVVSMPGAEAISALQSGAVDAVSWVGPANDMAAGLHQAARYYYYPGWQEPGVVLDLFINRSAWDGLDEDLQALMRTAAHDANQYMVANYTASNQAALQALVDEHGIQMRRLSDEILEEFARLSRERLEELAEEDAMSRRVYDSLRDFRSKQIPWMAVNQQSFLNIREKFA